MQWASEKLPKNFLVLLTDDSMFLHVVNLRLTITSAAWNVKHHNWPEFPLVCATRTVKSAPVVRSRTDPQFVAESDYRWPMFPTSCARGGYWSSVAIMSELFRKSVSLQHVRTTDAWVTGVLRRGIGMPSRMLLKAAKQVTYQLPSWDNEGKTRLAQMREAWENVRTWPRKHVRLCSC